MIQATRIEAISLTTPDFGPAVLVQDGAEWSGLRRFKCIAPADLDGQTIIAAKDDASPFAALFGEIMGVGTVNYAILMASPGLAAQIKKASQQE